MDDNYIKQYIQNFINNNKRICKKSFSTDIINYLDNRYNDSESTLESLYRIMNNIEIRPICKHCNNKVKFKNFRKGFNIYCSNSCAQSDPEIYTKIINTKINKYNSANNYQKIKQSKLEKYNDPYYVNPKKTKQTKLQKYGNENYTNLKKSKQTCLKKYGSEYYFTSKDCKEKLINKFNVDNYRKTLESKQKTSEYIKTHQQDIRRKVINTCLKKYGVDNVAKCQFIKDKIDWKKQKEKEYITKKKNNSFNISKPEDQSYILLKSKYPDVQKQYRSEAYPFNCDFYIPSLDLYIECNYHWTHGFHPYNPNSIEDQKQLELWKSKQTKYYDNAINTWTIRDVNKRHTAKENKLNWIEFFSILKLNKWLENKYEI